MGGGADPLLLVIKFARSMGQYHLAGLVVNKIHCIAVYEPASYVQFLDVSPPHHIAETLHEIGQPDGGHEQNDRLLIDQMLQNEFFHQIGK